MPTYHITITVEVPDVEADDPDDAVDAVRQEISSAFAQPVRFVSSNAVEYDEE